MFTNKIAVLNALKSANRPMRSMEIVTATNLPGDEVFAILQNLVADRLVTRPETNVYAAA